MAVNYKILFEVKLLHEYYLTEKDGSTIFDVPLQADRLAFLFRKAGLNAASIHQDIAFEVPEPVNATFQNYHLRLIRSYSGFKVFASVKEEILAGDVKAFRPSQNLPDDLPILVSLNSLNPFLDSVTNGPLKRSLPASYYFTNRDLGETRLFPMLSRPLPLRDDTLVYEQGDLVLDPGDNLTKAFFFEKNGDPNWVVVNGEGFVNRQDLALLPVRFDYRFFKDDGNGDATFVLKDSSGTTVTTISKTVSEATEKVQLDFESINPITLTGSAAGNIPEVYTMEVTLNGLTRSHPVVFCNQTLKPANTWGLVHLQPRVNNSAFNLLDDEGLLVTRINPDGTRVSHPVFELRVKSRFVFWKYTNHKNEKILDNAALHPLLDYDAAQGFFETNRMLNASLTPLDFTGLGIPQFLPNPERDVHLENEQQRVYLKIRVPKSNLFKV